MTKILGLDLDGVLYGWHNAVYDYVKLYRGYTESYTKFWSEDYKNLTSEMWEFLTTIDIFYSSQMPTDDCLKFINDAANKFDIFYVTSRPAYVKLTTEQYLRKYNFPFQENLIFTQNKVNEARRYGIDYFVEDMPENAIKLSKVTNVILMAQPWNKDIQDQYLTVTSINQLLEHLEA